MKGSTRRRALKNAMVARGEPFALGTVLIGNPLVKGTDFLEPSSSLYQAAEKKNKITIIIVIIIIIIIIIFFL